VPTFEPFEHRQALAQQAKGVLRKQMRGVRATIPTAAMAQRSRQLQTRIMQLPIWDRVRTVLLSESAHQKGVSTAWVAQQARSRGITVAYPRVDYDAQRVEYRIATEADLEDRGLETAEAPKNAFLVPPGTIDLVIVPVLAVDPDGFFVDDGSGAYDRVLRDLAQAMTLAVAFEFQLIPEAPRTSEDVPVAVIVTDRRVIEARNKRVESGSENTHHTNRALEEDRRAIQPNLMVGPIHRADGAGGGTGHRTGQCPQEGF